MKNKRIGKKLMALALSAALMLTGCVSCGSSQGQGTSQTNMDPTDAAPAAKTKAGDQAASSGTGESAPISPVFADGPEEHLTLVHGNNIGTPNDKWSNYFKELVEERSGGKITVDIYPSNEMGTERELTEGVQVGTYDIQVTGLVSTLSFIPALATLMIPYLFNGMTAEQIDQALNESEYHEKMQAAYGDSQFHLLGGLMQASTYRNVTSNKEIRTIDDLKGLKIRIVENAYCLKFWNSVGASPTSVTWAETYLALQQGVVEAQENPFDNIYLGNIFEVQKYLVISEHLLNVNHMIMNQERFKSLPDGYREVIEECASEARIRAAGDMADEIEGYHQLLLEKGMTEIKLDEAVVEALKEKSGEVREMVKSELGEELYNSLITAVEQAKQ